MSVKNTINEVKKSECVNERRVFKELRLLKRDHPGIKIILELILNELAEIWKKIDGD